MVIDESHSEGVADAMPKAPDDEGGENVAPRVPKLRGRSVAVRGRLSASNIGERYALVLAWAILCLVFSVLPSTSGTFPTVANFSSIFGSQAAIVFLTLALLPTLTASEYDLSVAATLTCSAMMVALLNVHGHWPIGAAVVAALAAGVVIGAINGAFVVLVGIESIIVTLGMGTFLQGVVLWISASNTIGGISSGLVDAVIVHRVFGLPLAFYYGIAVCVAIWYVFEFTPLGRRLLIVGRGRDVARLSGIRVGRMRWGAFIASGLISAAGGVMYAGTLGAADPSSGIAFLLPAFAAAYLGATAILPGRFNPWGAVIAVYFLVTGISGLELLGAQSFVQELFYGGALVISVALSQLARKRRGSARRSAEATTSIDVTDAEPGGTAGTTRAGNIPASG